MSTLTSQPVPGKRLFIAACIVLFLFSSVHMIPFCMSVFIEPTAPLEIEADRAMSAVLVDMGPFHTNWGKLNQLLSASYSALLYFVVALNFVALPAACSSTPTRLRSLALVNAAFVTVLLVLSLIYRFPPPAVFALIAEILFLAAWIKAR